MSMQKGICLLAYCLPSAIQSFGPFPVSMAPVCECRTSLHGERALRHTSHHAPHALSLCVKVSFLGGIWLKLRNHTCTMYISYINSVKLVLFRATFRLSQIKILDHCHSFSCRYGSLRLIDIPGVRASAPITMQEFKDHVIASSSSGRDVLLKQWMSEACDLISDLRDDVEALMPMDNEVCFQ